MHGFVLSVLAGAIVAACGLAAPAETKYPELDGKMLRLWVKELTDPDPGVREKAMHAVMRFGPDAQEAVPALIRELNDPDASLRTNAATALGAIGLGKDEKEIDKGVDALKRLLVNDSQAMVRFQAAMALGRVGDNAQKAIPSLIIASNDRGSWEIRKAAAFALGSVANDAKEGPDLGALRALTAALKDNCFQVRLEAIMSLIMLGPPHQAADGKGPIQALEYLIKHEKNQIVIIWAHVAVMRMEKVSVNHLGPIVKMIGSPEAPVRIQALRALGTIGAEAKSAIPNVLEALDDNDAGVVIWATQTLVQMKAKRPEVLDALEKLSTHKEEAVQRAAKDALKRVTSSK